MKQPKKLTYNQKRMLSRAGYDATQYMFCSEKDGDMLIWNKATQKVEAFDTNHKVKNCQ